MLRRNLPPYLLCLTLASLIFPAPPAAAQQSRDCAIIEKALLASLKITAGMTRQAVEKDFTEDGGVNFRQETTLVYKSFPLLKIKVHFATKPNTPASADTVLDTSKLFVEYPAMD